MARRRFWRRHA